MTRNTFLACVLLVAISGSSTVHPEVYDGKQGTMVIESFMVDIPEGNTRDETCYFVEALIKCNLKSLADMSALLALQDQAESCHVSERLPLQDQTKSIK